MKTKKQDNTPKNRTRIFLVDDHHIVRMGLTQLINQEADLMVCGEAESGKKATIGIAEQSPNIAIIDIGLGEDDGLELIKRMGVLNPEVKILVLSMHDEDIYAERALRAGAKGYIMKREAAETVITAIRKVLRGDIYLSATMSERLLNRIFRGTPTACGLHVEDLSDRELEVFELIGIGWGTKEIAERLGLSIKTIETYREKLKLKLKLKDSSELLRKAIQWMQTGSLKRQ
jgi:DNA-binding NarL/FixJ family response regulator